MTTVNIVTSDRGWILERLASEITNRLDYVHHTDAADPDADINYFITYSCWHERVSRIQVAWFAHLEPAGEAHDKFFATAAAMDHALTQARLYEDMLRERGVPNVSTISPGVDLDRFSPKLNIGVVGRTYHTGRKGEHLVGQLAHMPEIAWHFTGTGWPGAALDLPDEDLPKFYRDMDYILVPSLYEGGPMCVVEALASGTEVIAPPVGWVPDFPHVAFKTGDVDDLRRVLLNLYAKKQKLRESVLGRTWDAWAQDHHDLFQALAEKHPAPNVAGGRSARVGRPRVGRVALLMHGNEANSQGGPSVRVPRTARELSKVGVRAEALSFNDSDLSAFGLVHTFNVWAPQSALQALRQARRQERPSVFSPIFLDLSERPLWDNDVLDAFRHADRSEAIDARLADLARRWAPVRADPATAPEPVGGYFAMVREMVALADHLILLSDKERRLLSAIGAEPRAWSVVHNPTDNAAFKSADPNLFGDTYGFKDFVLCVGRVEARKNQLMLAHALRDTGIPLVLIGHTPSKEYRELIERHGGGNVHFLGRLQPGSDLLLSAFRAARVATLPSWSEGAPLAALEAAAAGAALVLSDRSSEPDYFGAFARYADPASPSSIRTAILEAYEAPRTAGMRAAQTAHVEEHFSWAGYTAKTRQVYETLAGTVASRPVVAVAAREPPAAGASGLRLILDVTTTVNRRGRITGIARVELSLGLELALLPDVEIRFVHWDNRNRRFLELPAEALRNGTLDAYREPEEGSPAPDVEVEPGTQFVVAGSGWMQNAVYADGVVAFADAKGADLTVVIHDLIPVLFPYWFNDDYVPAFERNMRVMLANASRVAAISDTTRRDVEGVLRRQLDLDLDVVTFREGDQIAGPASADAGTAGQVPAGLERLAGTDFVLAVGAIHARKNHRILYDVWVRLAEQLGGRCPTLAIVGGVAWNGTDLARSIRNDKRLRGRIVILEDVDDPGLDWLYRTCLFTVYPSLYEGWGLPVCESLRYGKICLAADASSIREIAPEVTDLIDPLDFAAWFTRVRFFATSAGARREREAAIKARYRPTPWSAAAAELAAKLRQQAKPNRERARYHLGARLDFTAGSNLRRHVRGSLHGAEAWGVWTASREVAIDVHLPTRPVRDLVLVMKLKALPRTGGRLEVAVAANGRAAATWAFHNHVPQIRFASIPRDAIGADGRLRIELAASALVAIAEVKGVADDRRRVGIGLSCAVLTETTRASTARVLLDPKGECEDAVRSGDYVSLMDGRRAARMLGGTWQKSSAWGTWAEDPDARLFVQVDALPPAETRLGLTIRAAATAEAPMVVGVQANGRPLADWSISDSDLTEREIVLPADLLAAHQPVELALVPAKRVSPKASGAGQEARPVSVGLFDVSDLANLPAAPLASAVPVLAFKEVLPFKAGSTSRSEAPVSAFLQRGWYGPERTGVWSRGGRADLAFQLDRVPATGVTVSLSLRAFGSERTGPKTITAEANGRLLVERTLADDLPVLIALDLAREVVGDDRVVRLVIRTDRAVAPSSLGASTDDRLLGVQLASLETESGLVVQPFRPYGTGSESEAADALVDGWYHDEPSGRWSRPEGGRIRCIVASGGEEVVTLVLGTRVYGTVQEGPVEVTAVSQGEPLATWTFANDDYRAVSLEAPLQRVGDRFALDVVLIQNRVFSPSSQGAGEDTRALGVWIGSFEVQTKRVNMLSASTRLNLLDRAAEPFLSGEWIRARGWGCWSPGGSGSFVCLPDAAAGGARVLDVTLRPVASPERVLTVRVLVNEGEAATWRFDSSAIHVNSLEIPATVPFNRLIAIRFLPVGAPASPAVLSAGPEQRAFPLGLYEVALRPDASQARSGPKPLSPDEDLAFESAATTTAGDRVEDLLVAGWFDVEADGVWTRGREGTVAFSLAGAFRASVDLAVRLRAMAGEGRPAEVSVAVNGRTIATETVRDAGWRTLSVGIPDGCIGEDGAVRLTLSSDEAFAPFGNGRSTDDRLLGIQLARLGLRTSARLVAAEPYTCSGPFRLADLCAEGWHGPEPSGLWSRGEGGRIRAKLTGVAQDLVELTVDARVYGTERTGPARVDLIGPGGETLSSWTADSDDLETRIIPLTVRPVDGARVLDVVLRRWGAVSPSGLGFDDDRVLGVWLSSIRLDPAPVPAEVDARDLATAR